MATIKVTDFETVVELKDIQSDMKTVWVDGVQIAVVIKDQQGYILDHIATSNSSDDTIFMVKSNGAAVKTWAETARYVLEFLQN